MYSQSSSKNEDSLKKRYFYKLFTNLIGLIISMLTQAIIPRGLGPKAYGDFNFLSNFFNQIVSFLDMGTSTAFYTKLSQRQQEAGIVQFYFCFVLFVSILVMCMVFIANTSSFINALLWPGQENRFIYMAAVFGILTWIVQILNKMVDAYGITVSGEIAKMLQKVLGLAIVAILFIFELLDLANFFVFNYLILAILGFLFIRAIVKNGYYKLKQNWLLTKENTRAYMSEFYHYSHPLVTYAFVGLITGIMDRWLLQYFSGSIEQGFYGLSYQIGAVCFLFTSAMTPLLMREFSIAYADKDIDKMRQMFRRYIPVLYSISAYFACFVAVQADKVVQIFGGSQYKDAMPAVAIMALYPIHQTYGQLSGSVFYATGQTVLYRNIGITLMLIGLPVTYFLIAPIEMMGLNTAAMGLAIKMVLIQFIAVNIQLFYNAKFLKLSFWRYFGHQIVVLGCLTVLAAICTFASNKIETIVQNILLNFLVAGFLYTLSIILLLHYKPIIFGLKKDDIKLFMSKIKEVF